MKRLRDRVRQAREAVRHQTDRAVDALSRIEKRQKRVTLAKTKADRLQKRLRAAREAVEHSETDAEALEAAERRDALAIEYGKATDELARQRRKLEHWRKIRSAALRAKHHWATILKHRARKLRDKIANRHEGEFETWMLRGHENTVTDTARKWIAIAYYEYDLYVTSTYRPETPGSFHAQNPTKGFDCAGAWDKMVAFQKRLDNDVGSGMLELFGPANDVARDNGASITLAEGSFLETLHDTHDHCFFYG